MHIVILAMITNIPQLLRDLADAFESQEEEIYSRLHHSDERINILNTLVNKQSKKVDILTDGLKSTLNRLDEENLWFQ